MGEALITRRGGGGKVVSGSVVPESTSSSEAGKKAYVLTIPDAAGKKNVQGHVCTDKMYPLNEAYVVILSFDIVDGVPSKVTAIGASYYTEDRTGKCTYDIATGTITMQTYSAFFKGRYQYCAW